MAPPIISVTGSTSGPGTPGESRSDGVQGETWTFSDVEPANVGESYTWTKVSPVGSVSNFSSPTATSPTLVADTTGTWRVRATVDSTGESSETFVAVRLPGTNARIPAYREMQGFDEGGNTQGWHVALTEFMREVDAAVVSSVQSGRTLIETKVVTMAAASSITFAGLDGDQDDTYEFEINWIPATTGNYRMALKPNNIGSLQITNWAHNTSGTVISEDAQAIVVALSYFDSDRCDSRGVFYAVTGPPRRAIVGGGFGFETDFSLTGFWSGYSLWDEKTIPVTSIVFESTNLLMVPGAYMDIGTRISLYRVRR